MCIQPQIAKKYICYRQIIPNINYFPFFFIATIAIYHFPFLFLFIAICSTGHFRFAPRPHPNLKKKIVMRCKHFTLCKNVSTW
ncbi:hypothetical protein BCR42DRAFT_407545 [Absidia repens]|uniref:Uncharacterized protein n=1 Tax=Absidia repens TaxID=90262 RepID=A0A1X2ISB2_9FUNG|nr:hypothetical protein BCR42DRAFT_407545 [Absidia repens]